MEHQRDVAVGKESRSGEIIAILSVASVLSTIAVFLRCYGRLFISRCFGRDDGVMLMAQVLAIGSAIAIGLEVQWGLGRHTWTAKHEDIIPYLKAFYSSIIIYNIAACLTKMSIILQYRRIFSSPGMQLVTIISLYFLIAWTITISFLLALSCVPVAAFWDRTVKGRCVDAPPVWYFLAAVNLASDFTILAMPIPVLNSLQLPPRYKFLLMGVFFLGIFPCSISVYRIHTLHVAVQTDDPMWDNAGAATWSFLELTSGIVAACLPALKPVLKESMRCWSGLRPPRDTGRSSALITGIGRSSRGPVLYTLREQGADCSAGSESGVLYPVKGQDSTEGLHK